MKHGHAHSNVQKAHDDHRQAALEAMAAETTPAGRHRAQLKTQQAFFDKSIEDARADTALTKEQFLDSLTAMNNLYKASTDEIVEGVQHGVKG